MSDNEQQFLDARQAFRDSLRGHQKTIADAFTEIALAHEQQSQHRANTNNPHGLTKADVGLSLVENRAPATEQDIIDLTNLDRMITPATLKQLIGDPRMTAGAVVNAVRTPKALSPIGDAVIPGTQSVTLVADEYRHMYSRAVEGTVMRIPRDYREFEIYDVAQGLTTPIWSGTAEADEVTVTTPLVRAASYRWRCRDVSIDAERSVWSALARFTAPSSSVVTPTLTFEGGINSVVKSPLVTTNAFATEGDADIHVSTIWRLFNVNAQAPMWELVTTTELEEVRIPDTYLFANNSYQFEVIHQTQGAGDATSGRVTFSTMERFPFIPGPPDLEWGDDSTGYYGEIPQDSFISGDQLFLETGLSAGNATPWANNAEWVKIQLNGQVTYVARYPLRYGVREGDLGALGLMGVGKEITLNNTIYRVRSLFGLKPDIVAAEYAALGDFPEADPTLTSGSEWNRVIPMIMAQLELGSDQTQIGLVTPYHHNQVAEENLETLGHSVVRGNGAAAVGDSEALSYVDDVSPSEIVSTPRSVSWRPIIIVVTDEETAPDPVPDPVPDPDPDPDPDPTPYVGRYPLNEVDPDPEPGDELAAISSTGHLVTVHQPYDREGYNFSVVRGFSPTRELLWERLLYNVARPATVSWVGTDTILLVGVSDSDPTAENPVISHRDVFGDYTLTCLSDDGSYVWSQPLLTVYDELGYNPITETTAYAASSIVQSTVANQVLVHARTRLGDSNREIFACRNHIHVFDLNGTLLDTKYHHPSGRDDETYGYDHYESLAIAHLVTPSGNQMIIANVDEDTDFGQTSRLQVRYIDADGDLVSGGQYVTGVSPYVYGVYLITHTSGYLVQLSIKGGKYDDPSGTTFIFLDSSLNHVESFFLSDLILDGGQFINGQFVFGVLSGGGLSETSTSSGVMALNNPATVGGALDVAWVVEYVPGTSSAFSIVGDTGGLVQVSGPVNTTDTNVTVVDPTGVDPDWTLKTYSPTLESANLFTLPANLVTTDITERPTMTPISVAPDDLDSLSTYVPPAGEDEED